MSFEPRMLRRPSALPATLLAALLTLTLVAVAVAGCSQYRSGQGAVDLRIGGGDPFTWDPARAGDTGSSNVIAQAFEGLTAFDVNSEVQPALADSWTVSQDGKQITFHLRPGITFSDGQPITAQDFVDSWLRLIDPHQPSPLSSLLADVAGAAEYQAGSVGADGVGLHADADNLVVALRRPATYFVAVTASPSLAVVPHSMFGQLETAVPANVVVSGAYVPSTDTAGVIRFTGNSHYWAGSPPLGVIEMVTDLGTKGPVSAFSDGTVDYTGVNSADASWIAYDATLGPQLRHDNEFSVSYYGFNTRAAPFDEANVRLAFAKAVNWDRIVRLGGGLPATSMIPAGMPGRDDVDHRPSYDPEAARQLLADAHFPGGVGFPVVVLGTYGVGNEQAVAAELEANLGVTVNVEARDFRDSVGQEPGAPGMWTLSWSADYPHPHDFLGLLLETGSASNDGGWSNPDYDALIEQAAATSDPTEQQSLYSQAQDILAQQAPVVPLAYGESFALARDGLLGATVAGVGIIRFAGLDWAPGSGR